MKKEDLEQISASLTVLTEKMENFLGESGKKEFEEIQAKLSTLGNDNTKMSEELTAAKKDLAEKDSKIEELTAALNKANADGFELEMITAAIDSDQKRIIAAKEKEIEGNRRRNKLKELSLTGEKITAKALILSAEGFDEYTAELLEARQIAETEEVVRKSNSEKSEILKGQTEFLGAAKEPSISVTPDGTPGTKAQIKAEMKAAAKEIVQAKRESKNN